MRTYKDLPAAEELELTLWLGFLEDSVNNAHTQMARWSRSKKGFDLQMFFMAVSCIDDAISGLKRFLNDGKDYAREPELWKILKDFRKGIQKYNLRGLRNDILHRERLFRLENKKGKPLPVGSILILGGYNTGKDEYIFGAHKIKISTAFTLVRNLKRGRRKIFKKRLKEYYKTGQYEGMIPFTSMVGLCPHSLFPRGQVWIPACAGMTSMQSPPCLRMDRL